MNGHEKEYQKYIHLHKRLRNKGSMPIFYDTCEENEKIKTILSI